MLEDNQNSKSKCRSSETSQNLTLLICIVKIANLASLYSLHEHLNLNHDKIQPRKTLMNKTLAFKQSAKVKLESSLSLHSLAPY